MGVQTLSSRGKNIVFNQLLKKLYFGPKSTDLKQNYPPEKFDLHTSTPPNQSNPLKPPTPHHLPSPYKQKISPPPHPYTASTHIANLTGLHIRTTSAPSRALSRLDDRFPRSIYFYPSSLSAGTAHLSRHTRSRVKYISLNG